MSDDPVTERYTSPCPTCSQPVRLCAACGQPIYLHPLRTCSEPVDWDSTVR